MRLGRFPQATGDIRVDSARELRWAMSGEGLTPDKLRLMSSVLALPLVRTAIEAAPESARPVRAYEVIRDCARTLGGGLPARALRVALAIDYDGSARNLSGRRQEFADQRDPHTLYYIEQRMLNALVTALGGVPEQSENQIIRVPAQPMLMTSAPRVWNVPVLRDPHFVGRNDILTTLRAQLGVAHATALTHTVTHAVTGLGGVGKTWTAAEYSYRFAADYDVVWWVRAEDPTVLAADFGALHRALTGDEDADQARAVQAVRSWLTTHDRWLLVFDNANDVDDVTPYVPGLRGHVVVTSRNCGWQRFGSVIDVPALASDAATELVLRRTGSDDEMAATDLAVRLGGIPKVIDVAASLFVRGLSGDLGAFVERLGDGARATDGVWEAAFDHALAVPGARDVLAACVVLNPDDLSLPLLEVAAQRTSDSIERATGVMRAHAILQRTVSGLHIHRLVVAAARQRLGEAQTEAAAQRAASHLLLVDPLASDRLAEIRHLQSHAPYVADALGDAATASALLCWYARCLRRDGDYVASRTAAERAVTLGAKAGIGPVDLAERLGVFSVACRDAGRLAEAETAAERAVGLCESSDATADLAGHLHVLATIRCDRGDLPGARLAAESAVARLEVLHGPDDARLGRPLEVLAWIHREMGALDQAEMVARRALLLSEQTVGPTDVELSWRLDALAVILRDQGRAGEAKEVAERALAITEAVLGPNHRAVGSQCGVMSRILRDLGQLDAALDFATQAVDLTEATHGREHPVVAVQLGNLALIQADLGYPDAAATSIRSAIEISTSVLGADHRDVGWQHAVLCRILLSQGDVAGARLAARTALKIAEKTLAPDHPARAARQQLLDTAEARDQVPTVKAAR